MSKKTKIKIITGAVLLTVLGVALLLMSRHKAYGENLEVVKQASSLSEGEVMLVMDNEVDTLKGLKKEDTIYLPYSLIAEKLNNGFYDDETEEDRSLTYVLPGEIIRLFPNSKYYMSNDEQVYTKKPVYLNENGVNYLEVGFTDKLSEFSYEYYTDPDRLVIHYQWIDFLYYTMKDETPVHVSPDVRSGITMKLDTGAKVRYIGGYGNHKNDFIKIMTHDGQFGYIQRKHLDSSLHEYQASDYVEPEEQHLLYDEKIKLGWWYVASRVGNYTYEESTKEASGMNVISPTWLSLADNDGNINSFADQKYVSRAHDDGYKVWLMVDFPDGVVSPHQNLSRNSARDTLIKNLVEETLKVGADGINIDFEALSVQTGVHFVQFIKELSVRCHLAGLVLSVDNLVPSARTAHYDIGSQAKFADYIIIMTYDEHYAASKETGSVASIGFVRKAITDTAKVCDRSRIVMGIPFYTRLWKTTNGEISSEVYTLKNEESFIKKNKLTPKWDEETCQNYIEYTQNSTVYQMWCEDEASIAYKCADAVSGNLAGVACWRLGYEKNDVWAVINKYMQQ